MNKLISISIITLSMLSPAIVHAAHPKPADEAAAPFDVDKSSFVKMVTSSNAFEIESSRLAEQKAKDANVKAFAKEMVADHTKAGDALKSAAKLGDEAPQLSPKHAAMLELLKGASDQDFQPLYVDMQAQGHVEAVSLFATYAKSGDDAAVKAFAVKTLPKLEMHKSHVMKLVAEQ